MSLVPQCSGFLPRDPEYAQLLEAAKVDVPSLFIMGASDSIIPLPRSHALMDTFEHSTTDLFEHPGVFVLCAVLFCVHCRLCHCFVCRAV